MKKKFYEKLLQLKYDSGMCQEIDCTEEENQTYMEMLKQKQELPIDIVRQAESDKFYRIVPLDIANEELQQYCLLKQTINLHTIKNCVVFFTVLTVVSLTVLLFILLSSF